MKKGFTLIELLVVVLIIGILAAIALPMYTKAVEKSRAAEIITMRRSVEDSLNRYILDNGMPTAGISGKELADAIDMDYTGGQWEESNSTYYTKNWYAWLGCYGSYPMCYTGICRYKGIWNETAEDLYCLDGYVFADAAAAQDNASGNTNADGSPVPVFGNYQRWCSSSSDAGNAICAALNKQGYAF